MVYFMNSHNNDNVCNELINNLRKIINRRNENENEKIKKDNINFYKVKSSAFTGLGYVGFKENEDKADYDCVYAYISTDLLASPTEAREEVENANPFVFCWKRNTHFFRDFKKSLDESNPDKELTEKFRDIITGKKKTNE
jgi:hypothetical protein